MSLLQIRIEVPLPDLELFANRANRRGGFWLRVKLRREARRAAYMAAMAAMATLPPGSFDDTPWARARLSLVFCWPRGMVRRDTDSCITALKPSIDGITDTGLIKDSPKYLDYGSLTHSRLPTPFGGYVVMIVEKLEGGKR